ncbi:MAG: hypothetical protein AAF191_12715 [Verrucomicrobiota bacterium]
MVEYRHQKEPLRTPTQLFRLFEAGELSRLELHAAMARHAKAIIEEMEEERRNPLAAYFEYLLNDRAARRLSKEHGEAVVREILTSLAEVPEFPPAIYLWNAEHRDVPLHCFFRTRRGPIFRVRRMESDRMRAMIEVEYGMAKSRREFREVFLLKRNWCGELQVHDRMGVGARA